MKIVKLTGGSPWGFRLKGGKEFGEPLTVDQVVLNGKAALNGLKSGLHIVEINGVNVVNHRHDEVRSMVVASISELKIVVSETIVHSKNNSDDIKIPENISNDSVQLTNGSNSKNPAVTNIEVSAIPVSSSQILSEQNNSSKKQQFQRNSQVLGSKDRSNVNNTSINMNRASSIDESSCKTTDTGLSNVPKNPSKYFQKLQMELADNSDTTVSELVMKNPEPATKISDSVTKNSENQNTSPVNLPSTNNNLNTDTTKPAKTKSVFDALNNLSFLSNEPVISTSKNKNAAEIYSVNGAEKCQYCQETISDVGFKIVNNYYHSEHVFCNGCSCDLKGLKFIVDNTKLFCEKCANFTVKCKSCNLVLTTNYLKAENDCYHEECFNCATCRESMSNKPFFKSSNGILCTKCFEDENYQKCPKCQKHIKGGDSYVEFQDKPYHSSCFVCLTCKRILSSGKYYLKNGEAVCHEHA